MMLPLNYLETLMTSSPCLTHFDSGLPIKLYTDASDLAISAMLVHDPIAFWSNCLGKSEINYTIYEKRVSRTLLCSETIETTFAGTRILCDY